MNTSTCGFRLQPEGCRRRPTFRHEAREEIHLLAKREGWFLCILDRLPELPEVEATRRELLPAMQGARFARVTLHRGDLRTRFPRRFRARLEGFTVDDLTRRAKYLLAHLSSGETLLMHLGMSGSFRIEFDAASGGAEDAGLHDHVVFEMSSRATVFFNDPRRFGMMDLIPAGRLDAHPSLSRLGPEPLSAEFDGAALAAACRGKKVPLKVALMDQCVVAGLGNIYVSEALHMARLSPYRLASTIATPTGAPRASAHRLAAAIKQVLEDAIARMTGELYRDARFRVYDREGERCRQRGCAGSIRRQTQAGRSTFYCVRCQR
jgi:formamidopyrimidine-DNA glycosylase